MTQEKHIKEKNRGPRRNTGIPSKFKEKEEEKELVKKTEKEWPERHKKKQTNKTSIMKIQKIKCFKVKRESK